jgi:NAD dependent epimerase/dehydratase family enzyme
MNVHISGGNGFIGQALIEALSHKDVFPVSWVRHLSRAKNEVLISDYQDIERITQILRNCDVFVHLAARVHQVKTFNDNLDKGYKPVNKSV